MSDGRFITEAEFTRGLGGEDALKRIEIDSDLRDQARENAEDLVETYLVKRYVLPESPEETPRELKRVVLELCRYMVKSLPINAVVTPEDQTSFDRVIAYLQQVRLSKPTSPSIVGLTERKRASEVRAVTDQFNPLRQPVQAGYLDGLRPVHDVMRSAYENPSNVPNSVLPFLNGMRFYY